MSSSSKPRRPCDQLQLGSLILAAVLLLQHSLAAQSRQRPAEPTTKTGTLVEVTKQGRVQIVKYTDDAGQMQELPITPKIRAEVQAPGDADFLRPGQFIAAIATESNKMLFTKEVSVILFGPGRPPAGRIVKAPPQSGQSQNAYQVTGTIEAIGTDPDYPDYQRVAVKASGPKAPLLLEKEFQVTVKSSDLSLAPAGTPVEITGTELRGGRVNVTKVALKLADPLKAENVLGSKKDNPEK